MMSSDRKRVLSKQLEEKLRDTFTEVQLLSQNGKGKLILEKIIAQSAKRQLDTLWSAHSDWDNWDNAGW